MLYGLHSNAGNMIKGQSQHSLPCCPSSFYTLHLLPLPPIPDQGYKTEPKNYELRESNKEYETEKKNNLKVKI